MLATCTQAHSTVHSMSHPDKILLGSGSKRSSFLTGSRLRATPPSSIKQSSRLPIWVTLVGIFLPYTIGTTGKYVLAAFFVPALIRLVGLISRRHLTLVWCDYLLVAASLWMISVKLAAPEPLFQTASDSFALMASYVVGRAYFANDESLRTFDAAFRVIFVILFVLAVVDTLTNRFFTIDTMNSIFHNAPAVVNSARGDVHRELFGINVIRATSTFPHPILYGTFCAVAGAIFLYSDQYLGKRFLYVALCFAGCVLSVSSGPLAGLMLVIFVWCYDRALGTFAPRWKILWIMIGMAILALFLFSNRPFGFLISHFTLDPWTGYWRLMVWEDARQYVELHPIIGSSSSWSADEILTNSVDSVWLVLTLNYGLPMPILLLLSNVAACGILDPGRNRPAKKTLRQNRTRFTLVLVAFLFIGITVHFWDAIWMFWGLCLGIRVSCGQVYRA